MRWQSEIFAADFYDNDPISVGREILGAYLIRSIDKKYLVGKIVETEAYLPFEDPASHNFKGLSKRNKSLYMSAGHAYVHSMRQHCLLDIVTQGINIPGSVLIRALEPIDGIEAMQEFRKTNEKVNLTNGPGKLCCALNITREMDGIDMTTIDSNLFIAKGESIPNERVRTSGRIGISKATDAPLRFWIGGNSFVSASR